MTDDRYADEDSAKEKDMIREVEDHIVNEKNEKEFVSCAGQQGCVDAYVCGQQRWKLKDSSWCLYRRDDLEINENDD